MAINYELLNKGGISLGTNFELLSEKPLDSRLVVPSLDGLQNYIDNAAAYEGLIAYVSSEKKHYEVKVIDGVLSYRPFGLTEAELNDLITNATTAAMEFKGATATLPENPAKGDMYKVAGENISIKIDDVDAKLGDSIVYDGTKWFLIPSGDDIEDTWRPVTGVNNDASLTFADGDKTTAAVSADGTVKFNHVKVDAPEDITDAEAGDLNTRTYITAVETDGYGHITGYKTATENVEDTNTEYTFESQVESSSVYFNVTPNTEGATEETIYVDAYSKNEADGKFVAKETDKSLVLDSEIEKLAGIASGANKVEASETNGKIKIDGEETTVYTHPEFEGAADGFYKLAVSVEGHVSKTTPVTKEDITALGIPAQDTVYSHPGYDPVDMGLYKVQVDSTGHVEMASPVQKADLDALIGLAGGDDEVNGLMSNADKAYLYNIEPGAQVNTINSIAVNGQPQVPGDGLQVDITVPTGTLANKDTVAEADLDDALKEKVNAAAEGNHSHNNKALLDTYTQTEENLADAVAKKHEHANKGTLDDINEDRVTNWDGAASNAHTHDNHNLLNSYDQTNADIKDAVDKKHEHANAAELAKFVDGDKDKLDDIEAGAQVNIIEDINVNGAAVVPNPGTKTINLTIPTGDLADKDEISEGDLDEALSVKISGFASDIQTLGADKADKATTLAGYGIGDAYTKTEVNNAMALKADKSVVDAMYTNEQIDAAILVETNRAKAAEEGLQTQINTIMNNPDTEGVINSINEFTQYITDHGAIAEGFRTDIDANKEAIEHITTEDGGLIECAKADAMEYAANYTDSLLLGYYTKDEVAAYVDEKAVQADWNEADENSPAYVKNKPFYETGTVLGDTWLDVTVESDLRYDSYGELIGYGAEIELPNNYYQPNSGDEYEIIINGVTYRESYKRVYSAIGVFGPQNNDELTPEHPFSIWTQNNSIQFNFLESVIAPGPVTVKVAKIVGGGEIVQIAEKFIPISIARVSDVESADAALSSRLDAVEAQLGGGGEGTIADLIEQTKTEILDKHDEEIAAVRTDFANQDAVVLAEAQKYADQVKTDVAGDVYTKDQTYTQEEVDAAIEAAVEEACSWGEF